MNYTLPLRTLVLTFLLSGLIFSCGFEKTEDEYIAAAKSFIEKSNNNAAIIELKRALKINSKNVKARLTLGNLYLEVGDAVSAEKEFRLALSNGESHAEKGIVQSLNAQREFEQVITFIDKIDLKNNNEELPLRVYKAIALFMINEDIPAKQELTLALNIYPETEYSLLASAYKNITEHNDQKALNDVDKILDKSPKFIDAIKLKAQLYMAMNDLDKAVESFESLVEMQPNDLLSKLFLSKALVKNQKYSQAEPLIDRLLKFFPDHAYVNQLKGIVRYAQNDYELAKLHLEKAIQNGLESSQNKLMVGFSAYHLKNYEQSYSYLGGLSEELPSTHPAMRLLAVIELKLGYPSDASKTLLKVGDLSLNDAKLLTAVGNELLNSKDFNQISKLQERIKSFESDDSNSLLEIGKLQLSLNDVEGIINLEKAIALDDNSSEANLFLATEYIKKSKFDKALSLAHSWIEKEKSKVEWYNILALANLGLDREVDALNAMQKALEIKPSNPLSLLYLAEKNIEENNLSLAREQLELLLKEAGDYLQGLSSYFYVMNTLNMPDVAIQKIKNSLKIHPKSIPHNLLLAKAYISQKMYKKTITLLEGLPKTKRLPAFYWISLGDSLIQVGEIDKAILVFDDWTHIQPLQRLSWIKRARAAEILNENDKALQIITQGLKFIENDEELLILQTHFYIKTNQISLAQRNINKLSNEIQNNPAVEHLQGQIFVSQGLYSKALPKLIKGYEAAPNSKNAGLVFSVHKELNKSNAEAFALVHIEKYPQDLFLRSLLAENYFLSQQNDKAYSLYKKIIEISPNNVIALNNLAWMDLQNNKLQNAELYGDRALNIAPNNVNILDTVAAIKIAMGNKKAGIALLRKASEISPNNTTIAKHLKEALQ